MSSFLVQAVVFGVLAPGACAAVIVLLTRPWHMNRSVPFAAGLAVALGYVVAHSGLEGWPQLSPHDIFDWLPHLALIAGAAAFLHALVHERPLAGWIIKAATALLVAWLVLRPQLAFRFSGGTGVVVLLGAAASLVVFWFALVRVTSTERSRADAAIGLVVAATVAMAAAASGSLRLGQLGGGAAASMGGIFAATVLFPRAGFVRGAIHAIAVLGWAVTALAFFYASMTPLVVVEICGAPLVVLGARIAATRWRLEWMARLAAALFMTAVIGASAVLVGSDTERSSSDDDYGYGYR